MAEQPKPITDDDDEKELLELQGHPNAVAPGSDAGEYQEQTDEVAKEEVATDEANATDAAEQTADGGGDADPAADGAAGAVDVLTDTPAKPPVETATEAKPAASKTKPADDYATAKADIDQKIKDLREKKKSGELDFDEANDQINDLVMKRQDLSDGRVAKETYATNYWAGFEGEHGIPAKDGRNLWIKVQKDMIAKGRTSPDAMETEFEHRLEGLKSGKIDTGKAPVDGRQPIKPPVSAPAPGKNTKLAPPPEHSNAVTKKEKTDEEELLETVRKIPGGIRG